MKRKSVKGPLMEKYPQAPIEDLLRAYYAGKDASSAIRADMDDQLDRWIGRNCTHPQTYMCELEHAWMDGFEWDCQGGVL